MVVHERLEVHQLALCCALHAKLLVDQILQLLHVLLLELHRLRHLHEEVGLEIVDMHNETVSSVSDTIHARDRLVSHRDDACHVAWRPITVVVNVDAEEIKVLLSWIDERWRRSLNSLVDVSDVAMLQKSLVFDGLFFRFLLDNLEEVVIDALFLLTVAVNVHFRLKLALVDQVI